MSENRKIQEDSIITLPQDTKEACVIPGIKAVEYMSAIHNTPGLPCPDHFLIGIVKDENGEPVPGKLSIGAAQEEMNIIQTIFCNNRRKIHGIPKLRFVSRLKAWKMQYGHGRNSKRKVQEDNAVNT